jgi:hypothetical protein
VSRPCNKRSVLARAASAGLALSFGIASIPLAYAAPGDVNSVNVGQNINSGTYYNTSDGITVFKNGDGGLVLSGNVRLLESDYNANPTGNGGTGLFSTTGVFKLSGSIDASGLIKNGVYTGNGGKIMIDAPYFYQTGNIYANGRSGGMVQINVGSMTLDPGARIYAKGFDGNGGSVKVSASDIANVHTGAIVDVSGKTIATYDTNVINIEGGLVNINGILIANAVATKDPTAAIDNPQAEGPSTEADLAYTGAPNGSNGGTIRLVSTGPIGEECVDCDIEQGVATGVLSQADGDELKAQKDWILGAGLNGSILICPTAVLSANGSDAGFAQSYEQSCEEEGPVLNRELNLVKDSNEGNFVGAGHGGTILVTSIRNIHSQGQITANGGNGYSGNEPSDGGEGGTIAMSAAKALYVDGSNTITANGGNGGNTYADDAKSVAEATGASGANGGSGGLIAFSYGDLMRVDGKIHANGGQGGNGAAAFKQTDASTTPEDCLDCDASTSAYAEAIGGNGGKGGQGGLIVFSGNGYNTGVQAPEGPQLNPGAEVQANGGQGGNGGDATARASALALYGGEYYNANAKAIASAKAGNGGDGGGSGTVVSPDPAAMEAFAGYSAKQGDVGVKGNADAIAVAVAIDNATSYAYANGGTGSTTKSTAVTIDVEDIEGGTVDGPGTTAAIQGGAGIYGKTATDIINDVAGANSGVNSVGATTNNGADSAGAWGGDNYTAFSDLDTTAGGGGGTTGPNNTVAQTQANELLLHHENKLLLSNGEPGQTLLSDRLNSSIIRTTYNPLGNEGLPKQTYRNFLISNMTPGNTLVLDQGSWLTGSPYDLNTLTVNNLGDISNGNGWYIGHYQNPQTWSYGPLYGSHMALLSQQGIENSGELETAGQFSGGSIQISALNGTLFNDGHISTYVYGINWLTPPVPTHGGAMMLKAGQYLINYGEIVNEAGAFSEYIDLPNIGATIYGKAGISIQNLGLISADAASYGYAFPSFARTFAPLVSEEGPSFAVNYGAPAIGGNITLAAKNDIYNWGTVTASAYNQPSFIPDKALKVAVLDEYQEEDEWYPPYYEGPQGISMGGNITMKAGNRIINGEPGQILADGDTNGGQIVLAAGGNPLIGTPDPHDTAYDGFTFPKGLTPPQVPSFGNFNSNTPESVTQLGSISAIARFAEGGDGSIVLAGDQGVFASEGSSFNYRTTGNDWPTFLTDATSNGGSLLFVVGKGAKEFALGCGPAPEPDPKKPEDQTFFIPPPVLPPVFASAFGGPNPPITLTIGQLPQTEEPVVALANPTPDDDDKNPETPTYKEEPVAAPAAAEGGMPGQAEDKDAVRGYW